MTPLHSILLPAALVLAALPVAATPEEPPRAALEEARKASTELVAGVRGELLKAIEASGPLRAIVVCKYTVPEISSAISRRTGWRVTRVSLRPRNPALGAADAWEQKVLLDFEKRAERGERADAIDFGEVVTEPAGRYYRYMKALPMAPVCSSCHGPADKLTGTVKSLLESEYPGDRATGYSVGQIRGAVTVKRPL